MTYVTKPWFFDYLHSINCVHDWLHINWIHNLINFVFYIFINIVWCKMLMNTLPKQRNHKFGIIIQIKWWLSIFIIIFYIQQGGRSLVVKCFPRILRKVTGSNHSGLAYREFSFGLLVRILPSVFSMPAFMYSA